MIQIDMNAAIAAYESLTEQEKDVVRKFMNSPLRGIIRKVFGAELDEALGQFAEYTPRSGFITER